MAIHASAILAHLGNYEQAIMYMHHAMVKGAPLPLTNLNLMFYMSRLHERWALTKSNKFERAPASALDQARAGFARCYEHEEALGGGMFQTDWAVGGGELRRRVYGVSTSSADASVRSVSNTTIATVSNVINTFFFMTCFARRSCRLAQIRADLEEVWRPCLRGKAVPYRE